MRDKIKAIIEVDIPDYQIGQEVSIYFKDTMMIKGIVQEPKIDGDCISRQAVMEYIENCTIDLGYVNGTNIVLDVISELPSVTPTQNCVENALGALDCISRQAVLEQINCWIGSGEYRHTNATDYLNKRIKDLQTVNPQKPIEGHWEWVQYDYNPKLGDWHCSECRCVVVECVGKEEKGGIPLYKYCPQCGADMRGEQ